MNTLLLGTIPRKTALSIPSTRFPEKLPVDPKKKRLNNGVISSLTYAIENANSLLSSLHWGTKDDEKEQRRRTLRGRQEALIACLKNVTTGSPF